MCITVSHHSAGRRPARGDLGTELRSVIADRQVLAEVTTTLTALSSALGAAASERTVVVHDDHIEVIVVGEGRLQYGIVDTAPVGERAACSAA